MSGIYIHIPFCKQACYYCDFHFSVSIKKKGELVESLCKEIILRKNEMDGPIETIYFGGGTPSLLSIPELRLLIEEVYKNFDVVDNPEITLEANPDDLMSVRAQSRTIFENYKAIGINRLSIGIQSFFEEDLRWMNRAHNEQEAINCIKEAKKQFDNISIDLIYGIPGMSDEKWQKNMETAISFGIPHISSYALTVEPKTALHKFIKQGKISPVEEAVSKSHYLLLMDTMNREGYINYEFSNFGKEGYFSKNNTAYWMGKSYLGIGPSAHSFDGQTRSWNIRNNTKYIKSLTNNELPLEKEILSLTDKYNEYMMTGLRTMWGVSLNKVEKNFGKKYLDYLLKQAKKSIDEGLLDLVLANVVKQSVKKDEISSSPKKEETSRNDRILMVTEKGKFLSDGIASNLFWVD